MTFEDEILKALVQRFEANPLGLEITWERVEPYAIDDAARLKAAAIGLSDQGQQYNDNSISCTNVRWRMAVEFWVRCNQDEDIQTKVNLAKACVHRTMMADQSLGDLLIDTKAVESMTMVNRAERMGEGVITFDLMYRTKVNDISTSFYA